MKQTWQEQEQHMCKKKNSQNFIAKNMKGTKRICDQKMYSKLVLNKLKDMKVLYPIYTSQGTSSIDL